jgi:hypothetical protein
MPKYSKELLIEHVASSKSWAEVCRKMGVPPFTGSQTHLKKQAVKFGVNSSHFLGQASNRGKKSPQRKDTQIFLNNEATISSHKLRVRLIKEGFKEAKCECCGLTEWMGEPIILELDHKNSDHFDNRLDNLMIVCPNCHALETRKRLRPNGGTADTQRLERCVERHGGSSPSSGTNVAEVGHVNLLAIGSDFVPFNIMCVQHNIK